MPKSMSLYNKIKLYSEKNEDIINIYNNVTGTSLIDECEYILKSLNNLLDIPNNNLNNNSKNNLIKNININSLLNTLLPISIEKQCSITYAIDKYFDKFLNLKEINTDNKTNNKTNNKKSDKLFNNTLKMFFNDIENIYIKNDNNFNINYDIENRDKIIQMNLKTVISIAKRFMGMGLELEDLIGAGNLGLCIAFEKFKPEKNSMKENIINDIENAYKNTESNNNILNIDIIKNIIYKYITYGKLLNKFNNSFTKEFYYKDDIIKWVNKNIFNAKFNSVASMWIEAYIRIEILNNSKLIKKTKKDLEDGKNTIIYNLSDPINDTTTIEDIINTKINNDENSSMLDFEIIENKQQFRDILSILFDTVGVRERRIIMKKFGIGFPRPFLPKEICDTEKLSIARVSQIIYNTIDIMKKNAIKNNIDFKTMSEYLC